jgi:hypothetical protein
MPKAGYYAVKIGKRPGIYTTWLHYSSILVPRSNVIDPSYQGRLPRAGGRLSLREVQETGNP